MNRYKKVLTLKLPYCPHPYDLDRENDFRLKAPFLPIPSLALASLCGFLEKYGKGNYEIKAVDVNIEGYAEPGSVIDILSYPDLLVRHIKNHDYDVLALSAMFVFNVRWVQEAVMLSRKFHPQAKIILGGGYATLFPERCLREHDIDYVVIGEGEPTLLHILNKYNKCSDDDFTRFFPFDGYASREGGIVAKSTMIDLRKLPMPAWSYLDVKNYFIRSGDNILPIEGSRGCIYNCTYCCTHLSWGKKIRYKTVENVMKEIISLDEQYKVETLHFVDDNLSFSREWFKRLLQEIINANLPMEINFSNFSVKHLDNELIELMPRAGIKRVSLAVESGSPEMQDKIKKRIDFNKVREIVRIIKSNDMSVHICWMIGFPNETLEQINKTFDFSKELRANSNQFLTVLPYPGTELFQEAKNKGILNFSDDDLSKFDNRKCDYLLSKEWNYDMLQEMIYDVNIEVNFLNNVLLDTHEGQKSMAQFLEKLLVRLPDHVIAHIILGYLCNNENDFLKRNKHYQAAVNLMSDAKLSAVFSKYLSGKHKIIDDFNMYLSNKESAI